MPAFTSSFCKHTATMASKNILASLPTWISRWVGYRSSPSPPPSRYIVYLWSWLGAFIGISVIEAIFEQNSYFTSRHVPIIVASYVRFKDLLPPLKSVCAYGSDHVLVLGSFCRPLLRQHRRSPCSTTCTCGWSFLVSPHRSMHHETLRPPSDCQKVRFSSLACRVPFLRNRYICHASHQDNAPSGRGYSTSGRCR